MKFREKDRNQICGVKRSSDMNKNQNAAMPHVFDSSIWCSHTAIFFLGSGIWLNVAKKWRNCENFFPKSEMDSSPLWRFSYTDWGRTGSGTLKDRRGGNGRAAQGGKIPTVVLVFRIPLLLSGALKIGRKKMLTKKLLKNYLYEINPFCNRNSITVILSFGGGYYKSLNICLESIFNRK